MNKIKALRVCHVLTNYDLKFTNPKLKHDSETFLRGFGTLCALDPNVELMFKWRKF